MKEGKETEEETETTDRVTEDGMNSSNNDRPKTATSDVAHSAGDSTSSGAKKDEDRAKEDIGQTKTICHQLQINRDANLNHDDAQQPGAFAVVAPRRTRVVGSSGQTDIPVSRQASPPRQDPSGVPLIDALLVSDPPKDFEKCQICMAACEDCRGWEACKDMCVPGATFGCQNATLCGTKTIQEYAEFMALFGRACPDAHWTINDVTWDGTLHTAFFHCTYHATHTVAMDGMGPTVPTLKTAHSDYCYIIKTDPDRDGRILHIQKVWNDHWMLGELGWLNDDDSGPNNEESSTGNDTSPKTEPSENSLSAVWSCLLACFGSCGRPTTVH